MNPTKVTGEGNRERGDKSVVLKKDLKGGLNKGEKTIMLSDRPARVSRHAYPY